ncbi:MAG: hypothetical protein A2177_09860 [Spirochaetes bacterium RBG_13_68_11]|nr:MAG: hypothetical protein A2177_09860 [Spirochaetes bacterium RBG_13_68_11]
MKKCLVLISIAVALMFSATGCTFKGQVFLSFDWDVAPYNWTCSDVNIDDPSVLDTLNRSPYEYLTKPGTYHFDYYNDPFTHYWEIYYVLTAYEGTSSSPAPDAKFKLFLWENNPPTLEQLQSLAGGDNSQLRSATAAPSASSTQTNAPRIDTSAFVQKSTYEYTVTEGGYTLKVRGILWEPRQ